MLILNKKRIVGQEFLLRYSSLCENQRLHWWRRTESSFCSVLVPQPGPSVRQKQRKGASRVRFLNLWKFQRLIPVGASQDDRQVLVHSLLPVSEVQEADPFNSVTSHFLWMKLFSSGKESNRVTESLPSPLLFALAVRACFLCSHSWGPCAPVLVR